MKNYVIVTDATVDLPADVVESLQIKVIPMAFNLNDTSYTHYPDERELSIDDFYTSLKNGGSSVSSQISPLVYEETFEELLKEGQDVLYICFTSGLSGTYGVSQFIMNELKESYPDRTIYTVDSRCASIGEGMLVYNAAKKKEEGLSIDELKEWIEEHRHNTRHWFTVSDLFHLKRGGRISGMEAILGTALKIKPILSINEEGKLTCVSKVRGSKKELDFFLSKLEEEGMDLENQTIIVGHGDNFEQAQTLVNLIKEKGIVKDVILTKVGPVIGTHTGPGMLGLTFMGCPK